MFLIHGFSLKFPKSLKSKENFRSTSRSTRTPRWVFHVVFLRTATALSLKLSSQVGNNHIIILLDVFVLIQFLVTVGHKYHRTCMCMQSCAYCICSLGMSCQRHVCLWGFLQMLWSQCVSVCTCYVCVCSCVYLCNRLENLLCSRSLSLLKCGLDDPESCHWVISFQVSVIVIDSIPLRQQNS